MENFDNGGLAIKGDSREEAELRDSLVTCTRQEACCDEDPFLVEIEDQGGRILWDSSQCGVPKQNLWSLCFEGSPGVFGP